MYRLRAHRASATADLVAKGSLLLSKQSKTAGLVPPESIRLLTAILGATPQGARLLRRLERPWYRRLARLGERATIPGLFVHHALRKQQIERLVLQGLRGRVSDLYVVGAGMDTLAVRIAHAYSKLRVHELDHPETQRAKRNGLPTPIPSNLALEPIDLDTADLGARITASASTGASLVVLEGVLMYLRPDRVDKILQGLRRRLPAGSWIIFSFMERRRFRGQTWLANWWLRRNGEPFLWWTAADELQARLDALGFESRIEPSQKAPAGLRPAQGERIALARVPGASA